MEFIILLLSGIIGLLHLVIMGLEMFAPAEKQAKTFAMPMKFVIQKNAQIALKNMGIYNCRGSTPGPGRFECPAGLE